MQIVKRILTESEVWSEGISLKIRWSLIFIDALVIIILSYYSKLNFNFAVFLGQDPNFKTDCFLYMLLSMADVTFNCNCQVYQPQVRRIQQFSWHHNQSMASAENSEHRKFLHNCIETIVFLVFRVLTISKIFIFKGPSG